jgi:glucokinase
METKKVLCLDIGGTNVRFAMVDISKYTVLDKREIFSDKVKSITEEINNYLKDAAVLGHTTDTCVIGMAGPIKNNACKNPPHVPFSVDGNHIKKNSFLKNVLIINDFSAVSFGILTLDRKNTSQILPINNVKNTSENKNCAVIGAGTGLGVNYITQKFGKYEVNESEGGHIPLDFVDLSNTDFSEFFRQNKINDYDGIVSGIGLKKLLMYHYTQFDQGIFCEIAYSEDIPSKIFEFRKNNKACQSIINMFLYFYAKFAQKIALTFLPKEGIFIAGGIARKNKEVFTEGLFLELFLNHPTMKSVLNEIPVYVVLEEDVALIGCAKAAVENF